MSEYNKERIKETRNHAQYDNLKTKENLLIELFSEIMKKLIKIK